MSEEEEFEFRLRLEREQTDAPVTPPAIEQYMEANAQIEPEYSPGEAPPVAQFQRGTLDVLQGGKQLGLNVLAQAGGPSSPLAGKADAYNRQLAEELRLYDKYNPGLQLPRIAGNIASPASLLPGAMGTGAIARGMTIPAMGAAQGLLQPATDPENFGSQKAMQAGTGAIAAPILPLLGKTGSLAAGGIKHLARPFSDKGITADLADLFRKEAARKGPEGKSSLDKVIRALRGAEEIVPGSKPTAGQAISEASRKSGDDFGAAIVRLEKDLTSGGVEGEALRDQLKKQIAKRQSIVDAVKGTPAQLEKAIRRRKTRADRLYDMVRASEKTVDTSSIDGAIDGLIARHPLNKKVVNPLTEVKSMLEEAQGNPGALLSLSDEIDNMAGRTTDGKALFDKGVLKSVKRMVDTELGETEKAFKVAQNWYKKSSVPINRMKVGSQLADALQNALETETPSTFQNALRNAPRTIKKATGVTHYDSLKGILSKKQLSDVKSVADELVMQKHKATMANSVKSVFGEIHEGIEPRLPRILERSVVIANAVLKKLDVDKTPDYQRVAIDILMNPEKMVPLLKMPEESIEKKLVMDFVKQMSSQIPAQTTGREAGRFNQ